MIKSTIAASILMMAGSIASASDDITIYTGTKGGGYDRAAQMIAARLDQRGISATVENRNGSDDITLQACQNDHSVWIAQGDALYKREVKDGCSLSVLADYGDEVAMLLLPPGSDNSKLKHIDQADKIFVAKIGSGSELTARMMQQIEKDHGRGDDWASASIVTGDLRRLNALANRGDVTAALLVMSPNDKRIGKLLAAGWTFGELWDKDIDDLYWGEKPLYEKFYFEAKFATGGGENWGYIVKSFIGTTEAVELDNPDAFDAMLSAFE